ncbi:MAG: hypothetical protein DRN61_05245, partial [Thaumarchaeota archaeon]
MRSQDSAGNTATDNNSGNYYSFTTLKDTTPPIITEVSVSTVSDTKATIVWKTNELSTSQVIYGTTASYGSQTEEDTTLTYQHSVTLTGLTKKTTYHFKVISKDSTGNSTSSADYTFTTTDEPGIVERIGGGILVIEEIPEGYKSEKEWCEEMGFVFSGGRCKIEEVTSAKGVEKILTELTENPYLENVSEDTFFSAVSEMARKVVKSPLIAGEYPKVTVGTDFAKISWTTDKKSNSLVAIAEEKDYNPQKEEPYTMIIGNPDELVTYHEVLIENLESNTLYHFQVRSKPLIGPVAKSEDRTFLTMSLKLEISDISVKTRKENETEILFKTSLPAKTKIKYRDVKTNIEKEVEDISFLKDHKITLSELSANTEYSLQIFAQDEKGNEAFSPKISFSTGRDERAPKIFNVKTASAISPRGTSIQTIISWETDEFSSTRVYYVEGIKWQENLVKKTPLDKDLTLRHIVVLPRLKPGRVYLFRVESIDSSENVAFSKNYSLYTPQKRKTIIQIMIRQFEKTFG